MITTSGYMLIGFFAAFLVASLLAGPTKSGLSARRVYTLSAILLAGATLAISNAEECSAVDAFYLSTMVFTTIGYGDIDHPVTPAGRATVMALALSAHQASPRRQPPGHREGHETQLVAPAASRLATIGVKVRTRVLVRQGFCDRVACVHWACWLHP